MEFSTTPLHHYYKKQNSRRRKAKMSRNGNYRRGRSSRGRSSSRSRGRSRNFYLSRGTEVYVLDRLKHGGIDREKHGWNPICQVIESPSFNLFELEYEKGADFKLQEKLVVQGKEGPLGKVKRRLNYEDLTPTASEMLEPVLIQIIENNEKKFVNWINKTGPITIRRHYLELLPGVGKKLMNRILEERRRMEFESIEDLHKRVSGFKPKKSIAQRILKEMEDEEVKHHIFIKKRKTSQQQNQGRSGKTHSRYPRNRSYSRRY